MSYEAEKKFEKREHSRGGRDGTGEECPLMGENSWNSLSPAQIFTHPLKFTRLYFMPLVYTRSLMREENTYNFRKLTS